MAWCQFSPSVIRTRYLVFSASVYSRPSVNGGSGESTRQPHIRPSRMLVPPLATRPPIIVCTEALLVVRGRIGLESQRWFGPCAEPMDAPSYLQVRACASAGGIGGGVEYCVQ